MKAPRPPLSRGDDDRLAGFHDPYIVVISLEDGALYGNDAVYTSRRKLRADLKLSRI